MSEFHQKEQITMGLLTDPGIERSRFPALLHRYHRPLAFLLYVAGTAWCLALAHNALNHGKLKSNKSFSYSCIFYIYVFFSLLLTLLMRFLHLINKKHF